MVPLTPALSPSGGEGDDREGGRGLHMPGTEPGALSLAPLGEGRGEGVLWCRNNSSSRLQTPSGFSKTSLFQNRTTRIPRASNQQVRA